MSVLKELEKAFVEDHQILTRGLVAIRDALQNGELEQARELAAKLDQEAGPHIRFEEELFYPRLVEALGRDFVDRLYAEHGEGAAALRALRAGDGTPLQRILEWIEHALDHVTSCGTLLSHLGVLPEDEQEQLLAELVALRGSPTRWSAQEEPAPPGGEEPTSDSPA